YRIFKKTCAYKTYKFEKTKYVDPTKSCTVRESNPIHVARKPVAQPPYQSCGQNNYKGLCIHVHIPSLRRNGIRSACARQGLKLSHVKEGEPSRKNLVILYPTRELSPRSLIRICDHSINETDLSPLGTDL
ncbi:hypothetical protein SFRURICE_009336, partial [Spodoptera frugiperda]